MFSSPHLHLANKKSLTWLLLAHRKDFKILRQISKSKLIRCRISAGVAQKLNERLSGHMGLIPHGFFNIKLNTYNLIQDIAFFFSDNLKIITAKLANNYTRLSFGRENVDLHFVFKNQSS